MFEVAASKCAFKHKYLQRAELPTGDANTCYKEQARYSRSWLPQRYHPLRMIERTEEKAEVHHSSCQNLKSIVDKEKYASNDSQSTHVTNRPESTVSPGVDSRGDWLDMSHDQTRSVLFQTEGGQTREIAMP
jgi:hypothetical protein